MKLDVLLVDDEKEFVDAFAERLRLRGFNPHIANNGEQALRMVDDGNARIMILDLRMPGIDGLEVLRRVKKKHPETQVIILSGHGSEKDEEAALNLGAFEYLRKPADIGVVLEALKRAEKHLRAEVDDGGSKR
jgi:two-component system, OmpR family, response regulator CpxR